MRRTPARIDDGAAAIWVVGLLLLIVALLAGVVGSTASTTHERRAELDHLQRLFNAEAGLVQSMTNLLGGGDGNLGSKAEPVAFARGTYWVASERRDDDVFKLVAVGEIGGRSRRIEAVVRRNASGEVTALMSCDRERAVTLGGRRNDADRVLGELRAAGDVVVLDDAACEGRIRAGGSIHGAQGVAGIAPGDIDFGPAHDAWNQALDVASEGSPLAHAFQRNPADRAEFWSSTAAHDYFLETSQELPVDGVETITLADGPPNSTIVLRVDGHLWVNRDSRKALRFVHASGRPVRVVLLVAGNVYIGDDLVRCGENDSTVIVALASGGDGSSGSIHLGDAAYGTLRRIEARLFAERHIHVGAAAPNSSRLTVRGGLLARGRVDLDPPAGGRAALSIRGELFGAVLSAPEAGIPRLVDAVDFEVLAWRELIEAEDD